MAGYILRRFTCPQTVTHPSSNRAQCWLTTLIEASALTSALHRHPHTSHVFTVFRFYPINGAPGTVFQGRSQGGGVTGPCPPQCTTLKTFKRINTEMYKNRRNFRAICSTFGAFVIFCAQFSRRSNYSSQNAGTVANKFQFHMYFRFGVKQAAKR